MYRSDVKFVKLGRLRWAGHVRRMEVSDPAEKVLCTKPGGMEREEEVIAKLRWCDGSEEDVAWVGCRNWRTNA